MDLDKIVPQYAMSQIKRNAGIDFEDCELNHYGKRGQKQAFSKFSGNNSTIIEWSCLKLYHKVHVIMIAGVDVVIGIVYEEGSQNSSQILSCFKYIVNENLKASLDDESILYPSVQGSTSVVVSSCTLRIILS